ncbi:hypothetical protein Tco_0483379, partial [Tanacetum coccineum]
MYATATKKENEPSRQRAESTAK